METPEKSEEQEQQEEPAKPLKWWEIGIALILLTTVAPFALGLVFRWAKGLFLYGWDFMQL